MSRLLERQAGECMPMEEPAVPSPPWLLTYRAWLAGMLLAGWPYWAYLIERALDGSDNPFGILAFAAFCWFLPWRELGSGIPVRVQWATALLVVPLLVLIPLWFVSFPLLKTAGWMLALGFLVVSAGGKPALIGMLLLSLPVMASLDFYAGYPLRCLTAEINAACLNAFGLAVEARGAVLHWDGKDVVVDAPCSGIRMLWFGGFWTCFLSLIFNHGWRNWIALSAIALALLIFGNAIRALVLFFPESGWFEISDLVHEAIGLLIFGLLGLALLKWARDLEGSPS